MKPYDKDIAELMHWLIERKLIVRVPQRGPIRFEKEAQDTG